MICRCLSWYELLSFSLTLRCNKNLTKTRNNQQLKWKNYDLKPKTGLPWKRYCWLCGCCAHWGRNYPNKKKGNKDEAMFNNCMNGSNQSYLWHERVTYHDNGLNNIIASKSMPNYIYNLLLSTGTPIKLQFRCDTQRNFTPIRSYKNLATQYLMMQHLSEKLQEHDIMKGRLWCLENIPTTETYNIFN